MSRATEHEPALLPARAVNEFVYCPRLFWIEYVAREFAESYDTIDGSRVHRNVDTPSGVLNADPADADARADVRARSVLLSSEELGITARLDVVEIEDGSAVPIDFKRGKAPNLPEGAYDPERVQLAIQGLLLRAHGYACSEGRLYFAASKRYVGIPLDDALVARTLEAIRDARKLLDANVIPPPLVDSPKCPRCSLVGICLPDEINRLEGRTERAVRFLAPPADDRVTLYVSKPGASVGVSGDVLQIKERGVVLDEARLLETAQISLFGNVQISSQAIRRAFDEQIPVFYFSYGAWLSGVARRIADHSLDLRIAQHELAKDLPRRLAVARAFVTGKVQNQRTLIRRARPQDARRALKHLSFLIDRIQRAESVQQLLGLEGIAARIYFAEFACMIRADAAFRLDGRNRRPPTDPVNALLSFCYAILAKECVAAVLAVGFEPALGYFHELRPGRPSLALDLMEEFRPIIADSTVLSLVNTREIDEADFLRRGVATVLTDEGRRTVIRALERRMTSKVTHPVFGYQVSYRQVIAMQARLLARFTQGELSTYPGFVTR